MFRAGLLPALLLSTLPLAAQETALQQGSPVAGTLSEGDTATFVVQAAADFYVLGEVDQRTVDVVVRVLDPEGRQLRRVDGPARGAELFWFETEDAGEHRIQVIPVDDGAGDYEITLERLERLETDPAKLVDQLMAPYDRDDSPGAAVGVWRGGRSLFERAYGMANLAYDIPFEVDTPTNIGSTSKQFTAFAIMLQAERGALSLDDDIRRHIPELPEFEHTITVRHLITHTSGLREFLNLLVMAGRRLDHGDWIGREEVIEIVQRQPALQNVPGAEWNYNNTAFALAAVIVERTSGQDFHEFMEDNVFGPLAMTRTRVRPSPEHIVHGASMGYVPGDDGFLEAKDLGAAVGAGTIYSTVSDLRKWAENFSDPKVGTPAIFEEMTTSYVLADGDSTGYGYGLGVDEHRGLKRVQHGGADVAHRSQLVYYPEIDAGITTQSNHAGFQSNVAFRLAEAFFADAMEPEEEAEGPAGEGEPFDPATYDAEDFDDFVGRYALDSQPAFVLTFSREGETLHTQATGQPRFEIVPTSDSTFALSVVEASLTFHRDQDGRVEGVTLNQGGQRQHATRIDDDTGPWAPEAEELADFEGRYFSEEIETFYTVSVEEDALVLRQRRIDDVSLSPGEPDTFTGDGLTVSFERDRNGRVIAFYLANVRTRDVRFERVR